jgi:hypothetical protein
MPRVGGPSRRTSRPTVPTPDSYIGAAGADEHFVRDIEAVAVVVVRLNGRARQAGGPVSAGAQQTLAEEWSGTRWTTLPTSSP